MKSIPSTVTLGGGVLLLAVQLSGGVARAAVPHFSGSSLGGRWAIQLRPGTSFTASWNLTGDAGGLAGAPRQDVLRVGVMEFDGATVVQNGHMIATTDDNNGNTVVIDYTFTGTYTINADGIGTINITPAVVDASCTPVQPPGNCAAFEGPETYAISIKKDVLQMVQTDNVGGGAKIFMEGEAIRQSGSIFPATYTAVHLKQYWSFRMEPAKGFATNAPGDTGGVAVAPRQNLHRIGAMFFNGAGGVTGHMIATTDDNAGNTVIIDYTFAGSYLINTDGTGTMTISPVGITDANCNPVQAPLVCATLQGTETYGIAIAPKPRKVFLSQTNNAGGAKIFMVGEAIRQL